MAVESAVFCSILAPSALRRRGVEEIGCGRAALSLLGVSQKSTISLPLNDFNFKSLSFFLFAKNSLISGTCTTFGFSLGGFLVLVSGILVLSTMSQSGVGSGSGLVLFLSRFGISSSPSLMVLFWVWLVISLGLGFLFINLVIGFLVSCSSGSGLRLCLRLFLVSFFFVVFFIGFIFGLVPVGWLVGVGWLVVVGDLSW